MTYMKSKIISLLFIFISTFNVFANTDANFKDSVWTEIINKYVEIGSKNLNDLIRQNKANDANGESYKNKYTFGFKQVLDAKLPDGRYIKDLTPTTNKSLISLTFEDDLNERLGEVNKQLDQSKPKIYVGFDAYLGQAIVATYLQDLIGNTVSFTDFGDEVKKNVKYIKKWEQVEAAYIDIFTKMEGVVDLSKNPEGVEIIRLGVFDEIKQQSFEGEIKPVARRWVARNFEYYKGTGVNDELRKRLFDTDIRPSVFSDLGIPSQITSASDPNKYDSKAIIDYLDKFATNIKEALKGNLKAINCVDFPDQSTITSINNPDALLNLLEKFDEKCFKKLTVDERVHILNQISRAAILTDKNSFFAFFKKLFVGYGGENVVLAVIQNVPDALHARDFLRELISQKIILNIIDNVDGDNFRELSFALADLTTRFLPFDGAFERLLEEKKIYHWKADLPANNNPAFAIWTTNQSLVKDGYLYSMIYANGNHTQAPVEYFPLNAFEYVGILSNSPLPGLQMGQGNGTYSAAVPAIYLYWLSRSRESANAGVATILIVNTIVFRQGLTTATTAPRFWAVLGALDAASSATSITLTLISPSVKNAIASRFGVSGSEFAQSVEKVQLYYAVGSGGVLLTTLGIKYIAASKFWKANRQIVVSENIMSSTEVQQMDELLSKGIKLNTYTNIENWLNSIVTQTTKSEILNEIANWSDELLLKLDNMVYRNPKFYSDVVKRIEENQLNPLAHFREGYGVIKSKGTGLKEVELDMYALDRTRTGNKIIFEPSSTNYKTNTTRLALTENSKGIPKLTINQESGKIRLDNGNVISTDLNGEGLMYVIDDADNIIIGGRGGEISYPHPTLIGGLNPNVKCAGMIHFKDGRVYSLSFNSGHFKPSISSFEYVELIFRQKLPEKSFDVLFKKITN